MIKEKVYNLIILFGLAGSGKNYVGEILQKHFNYYFWDGDTLLTKEMQECIHNKTSFTQEMRDQLTNLLIENMLLLQKQHPKLVVAQALYKESNRLQILSKIPEVKFIYIQSDPALIKKRLSRDQGPINLAYAELIQKNFEHPLLKHDILQNNEGENAIIQKLEAILNS